VICLFTTAKSPLAKGQDCYMEIYIQETKCRSGFSQRPNVELLNLIEQHLCPYYCHDQDEVFDKIISHLLMDTYHVVGN
jgi:hypothetical protein